MATAAKPKADLETVYGDMEGQIGELGLQATLAMQVIDKEDLFRRAVEQLERMLVRFEENYQSRDFSRDI